VQKFIGGLLRHGYCVRDFAKLDAANYGVPQHRIRPFWFGHRIGPCIVWPEPTHCDPAELWTVPIPSTERTPWVTVRKALAHLPIEDMGRPIKVKKRTVRATRSNSEHVLLEHERHPISKPDEPAYTITSKAEQGAQGGAVLQWPWDRPATVVQGDPRLAPVGHHNSSYRSAPNAIVLSERAAAIIQGFPDSWTFVGKTKRSRWSQIGMAMPPPLAEAVGRSIVRWLISSQRKAVGE
jgi:DNA (cytosine-5)-methyltransferase 1